MDKRFRNIMLFALHRGSVLLLVTLWFLGLIFGSLASTVSGDSYFSLMRMAAVSPVSIVGLIASAYLPFLFSAFAVYIGKPKLIYAVCFCKAFLFAFTATAAYLAFGSAGWLVRSLLQFTDICLVPMLCWFCIRHIRGQDISFKRDFSVCTALAVLVGSIDFCVVSPFLAMLIDI